MTTLRALEQLLDENCRQWRSLEDFETCDPRRRELLSKAVQVPIETRDDAAAKLAIVVKQGGEGDPETRFADLGMLENSHLFILCRQVAEWLSARPAMTPPMDALVADLALQARILADRLQEPRNHELASGLVERLEALAKAEPPAGQLVELGKALDPAIAEEQRLLELYGDSDEAADNAERESGVVQIVDALVDGQATTLADLATKARAVLWCCGDDLAELADDPGATTDLRLVHSILRDLLAMRREAMAEAAPDDPAVS